ncbi:MAG: hypothetical protein EOO38_05470 [Cytophagaceae bacterium]|nr:hypothetical protein BKM05_15445 [Pseudomonas avellanae]RYF50519.1 MAG: hypothetical protein EOO38_05470 [Cytophagaceae bacterium]
MIKQKDIEGGLVVGDADYWAALEYAADQFLAREAAAIKNRTYKDVSTRSARAIGALPLWTPQICLATRREADGKSAHQPPLHRLGSFQPHQG